MQRRDQDRARGGRQAACVAGDGRAGHGGRRPTGHRGLRAQERVGVPARQRAAAADHAEQQHRCGSYRERAGHYRLRRQSEANRADHRFARRSGGRRTDRRAASQRVRARFGADPQPPTRRLRRRAGRRTRSAAACNRRRRPSLEQRAGARRKSFASRPRAHAHRATRRTRPRRRQHFHRLLEERRGAACCADPARVALRRK